MNTRLAARPLHSTQTSFRLRSLHRAALILAGSIAAFLGSHSARATVLYWDTNGTAAGSGAADGTWGSSPFWTTTANGTGTPTAAVTTAADDLTFSAGNGGASVAQQNGTAGTVTVSGTQLANTLTLNQTGLTFSGGTGITLTATTGTLTVNASATINSALTAPIISFATTGQSLTLGGGGAITTLQGTTTAIAQASTVNLTAGTLAVGQSALNIGTTGATGSSGSNGLVIGNSATASSNATLNIGSNGTGLVTVNTGGSLAATGSGLAVGRNLVSTGKLVVSGGAVTSASALLIGFQGAAAGIVNITSGTISLTGTGAAGDMAISSQSGSTATVATVNVSGGTTTLGTTGAINFGSGGTFGVSNAGSGTLNVSGGSLYVGSGGIVKGGGGTFTSTILLSGGIVGAVGNWASALDMGLSNADGGVTFQGGNAVATPFNIALGGVLSGTGGLTKTAGGALTLAGANTYTGTTILNAGILNLGSAETANVSGPLGKQLASAAGTIVLGGGTLQYSASNNNDYSGRFSTAASQAYNVDTNGQAVTWATNLTSSGGAFIKTGAGTLTLPGANTYSGTTTVNAGTLSLTGSLSSTILAVAGGTFAYSQPGTNSQSFTTTTLNAGASAITNTVSTGTLGLGTIARSGAGGTVDLTSTGAITTGNSNVNSILGPWATTGSGTSIQYAANSGSNQVISYTGQTAATANFANVTSVTTNFSSSATTTQTLAANATANTLRYSGTGVTVNLGSSATPFTLTLNGVLAAGASGTFSIAPNSGTGAVNIGTTNELVIAGPQSVTISTPVINNGTTASAVTYSGTGTLTFNAANTFSGGLFVNSGTVNTNNNNGLGTNGTNANVVTLGSGANNVTLNLTSASVSGLKGLFTIAAGGGTRAINNTSTGLTVLDASGIVVLNSNLTVTASGGSAAILGFRGTISGVGGITVDTTNVGSVDIRGANPSWSGGLTIKAGTVTAQASALAFGTGAVTLGDAAGSSATLTLLANALTYANAINLGTNAAGTQTIGSSTGTNNATFGGAIGLNGGNLMIVNSSTSSSSTAAGNLIVSGGISGTGSLTINNNTTNTSSGGLGLITLGTGGINNIGTVTNSGTSTGGTTINGVIGSSVSGVVQNSATSILTLSGANTFSGLLIKSGTLTGSSTVQNQTFFGATTGTINLGDVSTTTGANLRAGGYVGNSTVSNPIVLGGTAATSGTLSIGNTNGGASNGVIFSGGVTGSNNLTIANTNSVGAVNGPLTFSIGSINNGGTVTNANGGTGTVSITSVIGANVTGLFQNSSTSQLNVTGTNTFKGDTLVTAGTLLVGNTLALQNSVLNRSSGTSLLFGTAVTAATIGGLSGSADLNLVNTNGTPAVVALSIGNSNTANGSATNPNTLTPTYSGAIGQTTGSASLTKIGTNTQTLSGTNNYTGPTNANGGTLQVSASGSINQSASIVVTNGGTLLLTSTAAGLDQVKNVATVALGGTGGGMFQFGGSGISETVGALALSANSVIDFGIGGTSNTLIFGSLASFSGFTVKGWTGLEYDPSVIADNGAGTQDRLLFTVDPNLSGLQLAQINFFGDDGSPIGFGAKEITFGTGPGTMYEIVPVPEPSSTALLGAVGLLGLVGFRERRRLVW